MNNFLKKSLGHLKSYKNLLVDEKRMKSGRKIANSLWAILFSIILMAILFQANGFEASQIYKDVWFFSTNTLSNTFLLMVVVFIIASLGIALTFKAGVFNIGISGQMMMGGSVGMYLIYSQGQINHGNVFGAFIISILLGGLWALIAGIAKSFFKVHEVVSTILLNWIATYVIKQIYEGTSFINRQNPESTIRFDTTSLNIENAAQFRNFFQSNMLIYSMLALAIFLAIIFWIIFSKTTIGYKIKMIGLNPNASDYSGTNKNVLNMSVFFVSGMFAGLAGIIMFLMRDRFVPVNSFPLPAGFDTIVISLIAYNSPIGIVFSSLFYALFDTGLNKIPSFPREFYLIFIGVMMFIISISSVFEKLNPIKFLKNQYILFFKAHYYKGINIFSKKNFNEILSINKALKSIKQEQKNQKEKSDFSKENELKFFELLENKKSLLGNFGKYFFKSKYSKIIYQKRLTKTKALLEKNKEQIEVIIKKNKDLVDKLALEKNLELKNEILNKIAKEKPLNNQRLQELGYFEKTNLKNEYRSSKKLFVSHKKHFKDKLIKTYNDSFKILLKKQINYTFNKKENSLKDELNKARIEHSKTLKEIRQMKGEY
ncbi:ABC transporter permease subunit [Mycoplasmopsis pulmonis]|uniref:ABC transporter permease subunit n=1 Tax=Mycoplasmopsis pulmonis TaxID=2107 RepID=UPI002ACDCDF4|nr:hypothetical protein [Mycoplasmopsis pulmonis]MDZ7293581.1 hypothetical protein [Mycoplasmopsis pulmonis]